MRRKSARGHRLPGWLARLGLGHAGDDVPALARDVSDCVLGMAVGDALGVPFESRQRGTFRCEGMTGFGSHRQPAGTWSDDTSMVLALCDSYRELGRVDADDIRERFRAWLREGAYTADGTVFDCGVTTGRALRSGTGQGGAGDLGNGSLMRCLPMAFMDCTEADVRRVSAITHASRDCSDACVRMVRYARKVLRTGHAGSESGDEPGRSGGFVWDTYQAAIWCLEHTEGYRECALTAVNLGGDTDTTACVAGGLAGILYGSDEIPAAWLGALRGREVIDACLFGVRIGIRNSAMTPMTAKSLD